MEDGVCDDMHMGQCLCSVCEQLCDSVVCRAAAVLRFGYIVAGSLVPRLHSPAFYRTAFIHSAIKSWGVESGNEAGEWSLGTRLAVVLF